MAFSRRAEGSSRDAACTAACAHAPGLGTRVANPRYMGAAMQSSSEEAQYTLVPKDAAPHEREDDLVIELISAQPRRLPPPLPAAAMPFARRSRWKRMASWASFHAAGLRSGVRRRPYAAAGVAAAILSFVAVVVFAAVVRPRAPQGTTSIAGAPQPVVRVDPKVLAMPKPVVAPAPPRPVATKPARAVAAHPAATRPAPVAAQAAPKKAAPATKKPSPPPQQRHPGR